MNRNKTLHTCLGIGAAVAFLAGSVSVASGQAIVHQGNQADLTFFYESQLNGGTWHILFRDKGSTIATGYDSSHQFPGFTGQVGTDGSSGDHTFDSLGVLLNTTTMQNVNGTDYFISAANGSSIFATGTPDLGIRIRMREDQVALGVGSETSVLQFDSFNLTLNGVTSTNGGEFVMFNSDGFGNVDVVRYETLANIMSSDWPLAGHSHWHYGFTAYDTYTLNFTAQGVGGLYGNTTEDFSLTFTVIPEPSTYALFLGLALLGGIAGLRFRRQRRTS